jgi:thioredoxin reductase (NADPH)|tara:strand:+ start:335 stop:1255 length:921 start_codon:yes stop_codon:yes gene_type:complete
MRNVIIIGSGPAGWTAALYLARAEMKPLVIGGAKPGGQLMQTTEVENYPGFEDGITGPELISVMEKQAKKFGTEVINDDVKSIKKTAKGFEVKYADKTEECLSIIISTGSSYRHLGVPGEEELSAKGVSYCAVCDAPFFKGKNTLVVGGGDSAMEEALALEKFAKVVYISHRRDEFRASKIMADRVLKNKKIKVLWNTELKEISGDKMVNGVTIVDNKTNKETKMKMEGVFVAIGAVPNTKFLKGLLELDDKGYIKTDQNRKTNVPGIFAAGDVQDHTYRQAVTSAGTGCEAGLEAQWYVEGLLNK